jgi:hypothetical protein
MPDDSKKPEEEMCPGGCNNTGWQQSGKDEGWLCDCCDRACTCNERGKDPACPIHQGHD